MKEILFRAKRLDNNQLVEGYYWKQSSYECFDHWEKHYIRKQHNMDWGLTTQEDFEIDITTLEQV